MSPQRIQLQRAKGWRKPEGAVVVSRPSRFSNPFKVGDLAIPDRAAAVARFRRWLAFSPKGWAVAKAARRDLRGKDLCCWCPPGEPCHADVLLDIANREDEAK